MALIDKASLLMVPSTYEAGKLYNVLPSGNRAPDSTDQNSGYDQTRADFDFDRGSNAAATRVNAAGLIEKYRENLLLQSNQFDTTWVKADTSVTSGQADKDGGTSAWMLQSTSTGSYRRVSQATSTSDVITNSIIAKAGTADFLAITDAAGAGSSIAYFNLSNGTVGTIVGTAMIDTSMESLGNGFYRCSVAQLGAGAGYALWFLADADNNPASTIGANVVIQNAQQELGLVATDVLTSGATTAKSGVLIDLPRINYDANGNNGALLLEPSATQLLPQSEYFGGSNWDKTANGTASIPVLTYGVESPEGLNNAYEITFNTGAGTSTGDSSVLAESISGQSAGAYTLSFYAKVSSGTNKIIARGAGGSSYTTCNLTSSWKRFEITETLASSGIIYIDIGLRRGLANEPLNSSVTCQIYGANLTKSSYPTSYIPTMGTAQTRAADSCSVTGASDVIGQTEGTVYYDWIMNHESPNTGEDLYSLVLSNGTNNNLLGINNYNNFLAVFIKNTTTQFYSSAYTGGADGARIKLALAYKVNDFALYINGTQIATDASGSVPALNQINLNSFWNGQLRDDTSVKQLALFKERLTNAELATLTTL